MSSLPKIQWCWSRSVSNAPPRTLQVRSRLKYLVDGHAAVWAWARFEDVWPAAKPLEVLAR